MQSQEFDKNVNWNVKEAFFNLHINYMATFDWIKLLLTLHSVEVPSSPNSPPLFLTVFWGETNRSSLSQMLYCGLWMSHVKITHFG